MSREERKLFLFFVPRNFDLRNISETTRNKIFERRTTGMKTITQLKNSFQLKRKAI